MTAQRFRVQDNCFSWFIWLFYCENERHKEIKIIEMGYQQNTY